jgi:LysM repeat protein
MTPYSPYDIIADLPNTRRKQVKEPIDLDQDSLIRSLKLQLRVYQGIIALAVLTLVIWWGQGLLGARPYAILAGGKPVAYLATEKEAKDVIDEVKHAVSGAKPSEVAFAQEVEIARGSRDAKPIPKDEAVKALLGKVSLRLRKPTIVVSDIPVVAVDSKEKAGEVLEAAKQKFGSLAKELLEEPQFKEKYAVQVREVDPSIYKASVNEALDALVTGGGGSGTYVVESGDLAGEISARFGMTLPELGKLNPRQDLDKLQIGDQLRVSNSSGPKRPRLTVVVRDKATRTETMPYRTESVSSVQMPAGKQIELSPGRNGVRRVVVADTYENGVRTGSEVLEETIVRNPVPRRVAIGIKRR